MSYPLRVISPIYLYHFTARGRRSKAASGIPQDGHKHQFKKQESEQPLDGQGIASDARTKCPRHRKSEGKGRKWRAIGPPNKASNPRLPEIGSCRGVLSLSIFLRKANNHGANSIEAESLEQSLTFPYPHNPSSGLRIKHSLALRPLSPPPPPRHPCRAVLKCACRCCSPAPVVFFGPRLSTHDPAPTFREQSASQDQKEPFGERAF
ncbi:LOW QUALITY PROTEIN: hypothetical protein ACJ73_05127 [Blastomyces percursus]|uniref:Uncharacterized protein n=1 Tax=Blastomyces percursus TaxID=1658174 RepID=A0A1J9Q4Q1_9EURO|nr:LOW QUALITY PROTEIN: hypothetical protein ACJ73_05127 [Blastomyces percursus]